MTDDLHKSYVSYKGAAEEELMMRYLFRDRYRRLVSSVGGIKLREVGGLRGFYWVKTQPFRVLA